MIRLYYAVIKFNEHDEQNYFIMTKTDLDKKKNHYFRLPTSSGIIDINVKDMDYEFITCEPNTTNRIMQSNIIKNLLYVEKFIK